MAIDNPKEKIADLAKEQAPDFLGPNPILPSPGTI
jgi:hypothetical protein